MSGGKTAESELELMTEAQDDERAKRISYLIDEEIKVGYRSILPI